MSARSFRSVFMVASCAGAALGCYLVSLRVASERAALEEVESQIVMAQRDIRLLQTEIGTRGRLAQLERWNVKVLALSAPSADQFLEGGFQLAKLVAPQQKLDPQAPVVLASAPADSGTPQVAGAPQPQVANADEGVTAKQLLHVASLKQPQTASVSFKVAEPGKRRAAEPSLAATTKRPPTPKPTKADTVDGARKAATEAGKSPAKKAGDNKTQAAARAMTKPVRTAKVDPLAPLPTRASAKTKDTNATR